VQRPRRFVPHAVHGGERRTDRRGVLAGVGGQEIDPRVGTHLVTGDLEQDVPGRGAEGAGHPHNPRGQHGLLVADVQLHIGRCLADDELLDRVRPRIGGEPPDPALLAAGRQDHLVDTGAPGELAGDEPGVFRQHGHPVSLRGSTP
jgi:hypothetical protein